MLEINFSFGTSNCNGQQALNKLKARINQHEITELNANSLKKMRKDKMLKYIKAVTNTEVTQQLTMTMLSDNEWQKIKGFVHGSNIFPFGYLLQSDYQVRKL